MATNKKLGNTFEAELCEILFEEGFWAHNLAQNQAGQPADVLAARNGRTYLIDCKVCSDNRFPLSRMEENQGTSMTLWKQCGNGEGWFALKVSSGVYMIPHRNLKALLAKQSSLNLKEIVENGVELEGWINQCE